MTSSGMPKSPKSARRASRRPGAPVSRVSRPRPGAARRRSMLTAECGACAALANSFIDVAHALRARVCQMECLPIQPRLMRDVVERVGDEVDGHDVGVAEVEPHQRQPLRQPAAHALDRLEEVVGAVDLVHLAGARVAHDDRRSIHAPGPLRLLAHDALGLELRLVVGRGQVLALVEHVLAEDALELAGHGDRGDVVQAARAAVRSPTPRPPRCRRR